MNATAVKTIIMKAIAIKGTAIKEALINADSNKKL
jgi:hypothetical protein